MPIRPEFRKFYGRAWREEVRPRILKRAGNKCEQCGKPDRDTVWVYSSNSGQYWHAVPLPLDVSKQRWFYCLFGLGGNSFGLDARQISRAQRDRQLRKTKVQIGVAHLNHTPGDDRDDNLRALCNWCHLHYDAGHHHQTRANRKDGSRPLLRGAA